MRRYLTIGLVVVLTGIFQQESGAKGQGRFVGHPKSLQTDRPIPTVSYSESATNPNRLPGSLELDGEKMLGRAKTIHLNELLLDVENLRNQRLYLIIVIFGMAALLLVAFMLNRQAKLKEEWITSLETKNREIHSKTIELEKLNHKLDRVNRTLEYKVRKRSALLVDQTRKMEEYAFMNSHKLRAPIASLLGLINLLDKNYLTAEERASIFSSFKNEVVEIDRIVRDINRVIE